MKKRAAALKKARWGDSMMDGYGVHSEAMKKSPHYKGPFKPK